MCQRYGTESGGGEGWGRVKPFSWVSDSQSHQRTGSQNSRAMRWQRHMINVYFTKSTHAYFSVCHPQRTIEYVPPRRLLSSAINKIQNTPNLINYQLNNQTMSRQCHDRFAIIMIYFMLPIDYWIILSRTHQNKQARNVDKSDWFDSIERPCLRQSQHILSYKMTQQIIIICPQYTLYTCAEVLHGVTSPI